MLLSTVEKYNLFIALRDSCERYFKCQDATYFPTLDTYAVNDARVL